jgi:hypothetical protein
MTKKIHRPARKSVTMPDQWWEAISIYQHSKRIKSEAEAHRRLLLIAFKAVGLPINEEDPKTDI